MRATDPRAIAIGTLAVLGFIVLLCLVDGAPTLLQRLLAEAVR
jgi:hypothetical protein